MSTQRTHNRSSPRGKWTNSQYSHLTKLYGKPYHTGGTELFLQIVFPKLGQDNEPKLRGGKGGSQSEIKRHIHGRMKLWGQDVMHVGDMRGRNSNNNTKKVSTCSLPQPFTRNKEKYESSIRAISDICSRVPKESKRTMNQVSDNGDCSRLLIHFEETLEQGSLSKPVKKSSVTQVGIPKPWIPSQGTKRSMNQASEQ